MRCRMAFTRRLPPGFRRWRTGSPGPSPVEAGIGALASKRANPASVKRRGSPTSTSSSATRADGEPAELIERAGAGFDQRGELAADRALVGVQARDLLLA